MVNIIWEDHCEDDNILGIPYRSEAGPVSIAPGKSGNAMFANIPTDGSWTATPVMGIDSRKAAPNDVTKFGKSLQSTFYTVNGYPDVWLSFIFKIEEIPINAINQPLIHVFQLSNQFIEYPTYWQGVSYSHGWDIIFKYVSAGAGAGKLWFDIRKTSTLLNGNDWVVHATNQILTNSLDLTMAHRVTIRMSYLNNMSNITLKEFYLDDVHIASLPVITFDTKPGATMFYNLGAKYRIDQGYYGYTEQYSSSYGKYYVDDIIIWTGPTYYSYNWMNYTALSIDTTPINGEIFIDGVSKGLAPQLIEVAAGSYTISFGSMTGYDTPPSQTVNVSTGETKEVIAEYVYPQTGFINIDTRPVKGEVFIDGISAGAAPVTREVNAGTHTVSFGDVADYNTPTDITATVTASGTFNAVADYTVIGGSPPSKPFPWLLLLLVGGVSLAVGGAKKGKKGKKKSKTK